LTVRAGEYADLAGARVVIIAGKGATYYGIGSAIAYVVDVLLHDQRAIVTICSCIPEMECPSSDRLFESHRGNSL
jgi:malate/lactate dehydrogenase